MNPYLAWSLALFVVGALVTIVEVVVPSGGLLAVAALAALGGSLYCAYQLSGWALAGVAILEAVSVPLIIFVTFRILPKTSIGKNLILSPPEPDKTGSSGPPTAPMGELGELFGREGRAATMLRPSGTADIDGRRVSVVTNGEMIGEGTRVRVILVEGNRVVVEAAKA